VQGVHVPPPDMNSVYMKLGFTEIIRRRCPYIAFAESPEMFNSNLCLQLVQDVMFFLAVILVPSGETSPKIGGQNV